jgi:plastocyanin
MLPGRYVFAFAVMVSAMNAVSAHAEVIQIVMDKMVFSPTETTASVGDTIEWVNNDILAHTATARNGDWDVAIAAKKTVSYVLKRAGSIDYYCRYHPNMTGRIVVAAK